MNRRACVVSTDLRATIRTLSEPLLLEIPAMPIRRSALSAFCVVVFGATVLHGQQNDPFAEWDRQSARTGSRSSVTKDTKSAVTYFSPTAASAESEKPTPTPATGKPARKVPMRENSAVAGSNSSAKKATSSKTAATTATSWDEERPVTKAGMPQSIRTANLSKSLPGTGVAQAKSAVATKSPEGSSAGPQRKSAIEQANFESDELEASRSAIIQVSQTDEFGADSQFSAEENPLAEFLKEATPPRAEVRRAIAPQAFGEPAEEESAEELFSPKAAGAKRPAASASNSSVPVRNVSATHAQPSSVAASGVARKPENIEPQSPGLTVQWVRRGNFNVGQECAVDLVVQNTSKALVRSVMTEAVIPAGVEIVDMNPVPMQGSGAPTWTFGELKPGETRTIAMRMVPRQRGDVQLDAFVRLTGFSSAQFSVEEPMIGVAVTGPEVVEVGEQVGYVVRVSNPGTGVASNVVIQAAVPEGLEHRSGSILSIEIGTLNSGESRQARLSLTAVKGGSQTLAVRAVAEGDLKDETVAEILVAEPKLKISIAGPAEQLAGRTNDFKMVVENSGNVQSANVRAKYRIPEGFEYVSADRGGKYNKADHSIEWFVGTLQPDNSSEFKLTLRATEPGELLHQAGVISEHGQVTMCDYSAVVEGMAALDLKIVASDRSLAKGDDVTWEVRIRNTGSRSATNVGMSCELPAGMELIEAHGPSEHIAENGVMVFRSLPSIEKDAEVVYSITAHCLRAGNQRLRLRIASESISEPLIGEESATVVE